jgi:tetratricopeptide (TPR) repeat protein
MTMTPIPPFMARLTHCAGIITLVGCSLVTSASGQQRNGRSEPPNPAFRAQKPPMIRTQPSPPMMLPQRGNPALRFVEHEELPEPLIHLESANESSPASSRMPPPSRSKGRVNFNNLQSLARDIDQTLRADEEAFGSLMSEVDQLAEVIRQQKAHKERVLREKAAAEEKALAIQEELRNAKRAAEAARREAESLLRRQQALSGTPENPSPDAESGNHLAHPGDPEDSATPPSTTDGPNHDETVENPAAPHDTLASPPDELILAPPHGPTKESQANGTHPPADTQGHDPHANPEQESQHAEDLHGVSTDHSEPHDPNAPPAGLTVDPPPKAATHSAVDRQSLADSLFGTGEYRLALATYRQLIREEKPDGEKSSWLRFQTANCYRHLGEVQQAETYYREVAADRRDIFLSGMSRWWLEHLEERKQLASRIEKWKLVASQIENASK